MSRPTGIKEVKPRAKGAGRPAAELDKVRVSYTIDTDLLPFMERQAAAEGFVMKRSGKPNVSAWLNAKLRKMEIEARIL